MGLDALVHKFKSLKVSDLAPSGNCSSHLHIEIRESNVVPSDPPPRIVIGIVCEPRYIHLQVPLLMKGPNRNNTMELILEQLCNSYLTPMDVGVSFDARPALITTNDYELQQYLEKCIGGGGAQVELVDTASYMVKGCPLNAIMDAIWTDSFSLVNRIMSGNMYDVGEKLGESFKQKANGKFKSTVKNDPRREITVPTRLSYCRACGKLCKCKKCSRCRVAFYCNKACMVNDWKKRHKQECKPAQ
mmetsp:Transcript_28763/g.46551  ORF Transcript_28763/g.46551 Transcript_28763/m.46551 type:complete len:245 (-) Transcript_28763:1057-1791(-)